MEDFIDRLRRRLTMDLPGEDAQYRMAPVGRPRTCDAWPMDGPVRQSAVLLYLFTEHDDWHTVLMKRPEYDGAHGGQVSIPGGQLEPGEDHSEAALREFAEETGVHVDSRQLLGRLSEPAIRIRLAIVVDPISPFVVGRRVDDVEVDPRRLGVGDDGSAFFGIDVFHAHHQRHPGFCHRTGTDRSRNFHDARHRRY